MRRPWSGDVTLAAAAVTLDLLLTSDVMSDVALGRVGPALGTAGLAVGAFAALAWRRAYPLAVLAVLLVHLVVADVVLTDHRPLLGVPIALYTVAALRGIRASVAAAVVSWLTTATVSVVDELSRPLAPLDTPAGVTRGLVLVQLVICAGVWALGRWRQSSWLASRRFAELSELRRREAVASERSALARDLHDVVSRSVTIMVLHASGASGFLRTQPDRAAEALEQVHVAGVEAMAELRRMLSVLRETGDGPDEHTGSRASPDLTEVVSPFRTAGLPVTLTTEGTPRPLTAPIELALVRVVQEGLTNALRYAGTGSAASVTLRWALDTVTVEVADDGGGTPLSATDGMSTGTGLVGLAERVALCGGTVELGPRAEGGFALHAQLPSPRKSAERTVSADAPG